MKAKTNSVYTKLGHCDYLGSISYITDAKANTTQFDAYLPYGELLVDEHTSSEDMPYKFNGKELDQETELYYYGARYMNPVTSLWYGVDPMVEKYPNITAFNYCFNNPINHIDPLGEDTVNLLPPPNRDARTFVLKMDYKYMDADPNIINVWGHGSPDGIEYNGEMIDNAKSFDQILKSHSTVWKQHKQGDFAIIVLHSCTTADFANELSKDKLFDNVLIIAPNKNIQIHYKQGNRIGYSQRYHQTYYRGYYGYTTVSNINPLTKRQELGKWIGYKNGRVYNNYSGKASSKPGSKGFEYRTFFDIIFGSR